MVSYLEELDDAIRSGTPESRERALWHATDLLMVGRYTDEEIWVFGEVIGRLASEIDLAPGQLLDKLASDQTIEEAGPVLRYAERIDIRTLLKSANTQGQQHLLA